ncbi:hypothetical protein Anas_12300 [Armadillidium nasatum]|uniref:Uncharacterized protein n=1 Tax=Armadillidium nasatum TaxID=96803 RepID=A0A5N5SMA5_9CRUS|nr:hypothetical protein Anas_12300 [Armadillidium nasatum]
MDGVDRDTTYGSDSYWKSGSRSYPDSRSRFDDRSATNDYNNASRSYQSQVPNPPGGNFGNSGNYNSRNSSTGPSGPPNFNSGPQGYNSNSAPGNYASGGPNFGGSGPPARQQGPMGGPSTRNSGYGSAPTENLFSSIQTLSEIGKNDFASKILSAVLQTNLIGAAQQGSSFSGQGFMGNQQGPRFNDNQMGGYSDRNKYSSRSSRIGGGRAPPPRHSGPSGGPSRFSRERLRNLRISFPANRSKYDRAFPVRSRSSLSRKHSLSRSTPPRDASKSKRHRSNSRERRESPRIKEENDSPNRKERASEEKEKENDDNESSDKKDDIPVAALYCHMCKHGNFTSVKTYLYHLDGVKHRKTAMAFHARNETTLDYLRTNAQLANVRFGGKESGVPTSQCTIVNKFLSPTCCGRYFKNRYDMNEHRLSLPSFKAKPGKWNHDDIVKQLMSRNPVSESHLTFHNIPPFDGNTFIGIKFLRPKEATYCKPCKILLPVGINSLERHMVSLEHYDNVMDYLREKRKRKMEGGYNKEGKDGEERFTDSDDSDEEKDADGNPVSSRFTRTRERDEDDEDDDDEDEEGAVVAVKGSDDEDEKDDMPFFDEASHIVLEEIGEDMPKQEGGSPKEKLENMEYEGDEDDVQQEEEGNHDEDQEEDPQEEMNEGDEVQEE